MLNMSDYVEQPDGRLVAGPQIQAAPQRSRAPFILIAVFAAFAIGLLGGYLSPHPETTMGEAVFAEVQAGCIPVPLTPKVGPDEDSVNDALDAQVVAIQGAKHERFIGPIPAGPVADRYNTSRFIGLVIGFNCLEGGGA